MYGIELASLATNVKLQDQITINKGTLKTALLLEPKPNSSGERGWRDRRQLIHKMSIWDQKFFQGKLRNNLRMTHTEGISGNSKQHIGQSFFNSCLSHLRNSLSGKISS